MAHHRRSGKGQKPTKDILYVRDGGVCGLCGGPVAWSEASVEHLVPLSRGGANKLHNTYLAHIRCNEAKADRLPTIAEMSKQYDRLGWRHRDLYDVAVFK